MSYSQELPKVKSFRISHEHVSKISNVKHTYYQQQHNEIDIHNAVYSSHENAAGELIKTTTNLITDAQQKINTEKPTRSIIQAFDDCLKYNYPGADVENNARITKSARGKNQAQSWTCEALSEEEIQVKLIYQPSGDQIRLCWEFSYITIDSKHWWNIRLDTETGEVLDKTDWTSNCGFDQCAGHSHQQALFVPRTTNSMMIPEYSALPIPVESPNHGPRDTISDPSNIDASPFGWHDDNGATGAEYTTTKGNNVEAKEDRGGDNEGSGGTFAQGGSNLDFRFSLDLGMQPTVSQDASLTNLFYWNNLMHDVWHKHGFDEAAGNFQTNNYGNGGMANDAVRADGMDGIGRGNANFSTPSDGQKPRMQMYLWDAPGTSNAFNLTAPNTNGYVVERASFGALNYNVTSTQLILAAPINACSSLTNAAAIAGKIVIIDKSTSCNFGAQAKRAQDAGALGVIICNDFSNNSTFIANGRENTLLVTIPVVMMGLSNCTEIKTLIAGNSVFGSLSATVTVQKDSDFDNGIIAHEYGHGISNRLTGGAGNPDCLSNQEQMGEGWSDWFALMMTMKSTDTAIFARGIGTYALSQPITGSGIRPYRYTTDMAINPYTYNSIKTVTIPHGVGAVWCAMLWEMTWKLIDLYGFDPDLYNGDGGNQKAMKLVIEAMKLQPCSPGFVDARDAILAADKILYNGDHQCLIWEAFAKRGLGYNAIQGSTLSRADGTESFTLHPICYLVPKITANKPIVIEKDTLTYRLSVRNVSTTTLTNVVISDTLPVHTEFVSASNGGTFNGVRVVFPGVSIPVGDSIVRFLVVKLSKIAPGGPYSLMDGAEQTLTTNWTSFATMPTTGTWTSSTTSPRTGAKSYFAVDYSSPNDMYLTLKPIRKLKAGSQMSFWHSYNVETNWDGGRVQISKDNGISWQDLGPKMTLNPYNGYVNNTPSIPAFSGNSNGYIQTIINLSDYANENVSIRFWMHCDAGTGGVGWRIDDIVLDQMQSTILNKAQVLSTQTQEYRFEISNPTELDNCTVTTNVLNAGEGSLRFAYDCASTGDTIFFAQSLSNAEILLNSSMIIDKNIILKHIFSPQVIVKNVGTGPTMIINNGVSALLDNIGIVGSTTNSPRAILNNGLLECKSITVIDPLLNSNTGESILNNGILLFSRTNILKQ